MSTTPWEDLATGESGDIAIERAYLKRAEQMYRLFCRKQRDYGRGNIAKFGARGVLVRVSDKVERLINLQDKGPSNESVQDTWIDISTYGTIGLMCHCGDWPGSPESKP